MNEREPCLLGSHQCASSQSRIFIISTAACALQNWECYWLVGNMAQFLRHTLANSFVCVKIKGHPCIFFYLFLCLCDSKNNEYAEKTDLSWLFGSFCMWRLMKDPLLHEKPLQWWKERERESPSLALLEISTKGRDGGRVKQADCLESNKTRRLRGPGSSFGSFDWFQRIGLGPTHRESFKLLIVGSPSLKISVYSKHILLRPWP